MQVLSIVLGDTTDVVWRRGVAKQGIVIKTMLRSAGRSGSINDMKVTKNGKRHYPVRGFQMNHKNKGYPGHEEGATKNVQICTVSSGATALQCG